MRLSTIHYIWWHIIGFCTQKIASLLLSQLARMLIFINAYYIIADALCASISSPKKDNEEHAAVCTLSVPHQEPGSSTKADANTEGPEVADSGRY